jgi:hypothetical protein
LGSRAKLPKSRLCAIPDQFSIPTDGRNTLVEKLAPGIEARYTDRNGRDNTSKAIADRAKDAEGYVPISALDLSEVTSV